MIEDNHFGNVEPKLMEQKINIVSIKLEQIVSILNNLNDDLVRELGLYDKSEEGWKLLERNFQFQLGNKKKNVLDDIDLLRKNIIHSYSKTLVHFDNLNNLRELTQKYKTEMYWFIYNAQISIRLLGTMDDYLYRFVHEFRGFQLKYDFRFQRKLKRKLNQKGYTDLVKVLYEKDETLRLYRNDITHNFNLFGNKLLTKEKHHTGIIGYGSSKSPIEDKEHFVREFNQMLETMVNKYTKVFHEYKKITP